MRREPIPARRRLNTTMSGEAYRWTAKTPSELYHVLGPHGVDDLIRQALAACWRDLPEESRNLRAALAAARGVAERNVAVWRRIKQPTPEAFFAELGHTDADGHFRQAMVLCWMMMPRTGGWKVSDALKIVSQIFGRNLAAWEEDDATFTGKAVKKPRKPVVAAGKAKGGRANAAKAKPAAPKKASRAQPAKKRR